MLQKATAILDQVKGKHLSLDERKNLSIELAAILLKEAHKIRTRQEIKQEKELAGIIQDPAGKNFITALTDQCFRSHSPYRVASQLTYTIKKYGIPKYLSFLKKTALYLFKLFGRILAPITVPMTIEMIRKETARVIIPGEKKAFESHMEKRRQENVRMNINHLGEAVLGEKEASHRLQVYLQDLADPLVEYISVKISTIFSQINMLAWNDTVDTLAERLRTLYRAAMQHHYLGTDGSKVPKFVNLDMEEYRDMRLTVAAFRKVLDEPEFLRLSAGIVLQSYLPDSFLIQQELTLWAQQRKAQGGAPIKLRLVKGANLAMEQVEASLQLWPQAPYTSKQEVDANFKRMISFAFKPDHIEAVHIGIGSHNLFDIAYALILRAENQVEEGVSFEMLEGMADPMRRVVQQVSGDMLLYCPIAKKEEFQNAVAYLVRRLDENTGPQNFLRHVFNLMPDSPQWHEQVLQFTKACFSMDQISYLPRRTQNRSNEPKKSTSSFVNEPNTDWSLPQNQVWAQKILSDWKTKKINDVPSFATAEQAETVLQIAQQSHWKKTSIEERINLLGEVSNLLRVHRDDLIGVMIADTAKTIPEADVEVSEAIDFTEYYRFNLLEWHSLRDIQWKPKGVVLVTPPWNFPCSIPIGGIVAALAAGNNVIFKPPVESVLVGWVLVQLLWQAGIPKDALQFITCEDEPVGSLLIKDPRISVVVLTGATSTAKLFLKMRPGLDLMAETGGKNTMVISALSDHDLAIKDLVQSAFGHAGQKCSACSLAILEAEIYDDPAFRKQLYDATSSLTVGSPWDPKTKINPLIRPPNETLLRGLTTLDEGEEWLLEPKQLTPQLWSPGIKLGVKSESFTFQNELFGPVLGLVRANNFKEALNIANQTSYGLTAGIHSLDDREQELWFNTIEAGNCYINRTITGAIVQRQPFGGCKESSFGKGAKAGGPNYLTQLMTAEQIALPDDFEKVSNEVQAFSDSIKPFIKDRKNVWRASIESYAFHWNHYFSKKHDPSKVLGQDNFQAYVPHRQVVLRVQENDSHFDVFRVVAGAMTCRTPLEISLEDNEFIKKASLPSFVTIKIETENEFIKRVDNIKRVRLINEPSLSMQQALGIAGCNLNRGAVMVNGRLELLHYLREVSISKDYHRYGNLGDREFNVVL